MSTSQASSGRRAKLLSIAVFLAFLAMAGVAVFAYMSYRSALSQLVIERDHQLAFLSAARLSDEFAKFTELLDSASTAPGLASSDNLRRRRALQDVSDRLSVFDGGVVLLDNFGKVVAAEPARPEIIGEDWSDRDYFLDMLIRRRFVLSDALADGPGGGSVVVMAVPVRSDRGELLGALVGMFRLGESTISPFYASIVRMRLGQSGNTYLVDGSGTILYDSGTSGIGQNLSTRKLPAQVLTGSSGALRLRDEGGRDVITAYAPIPGTDWVLVTEDDWALLMSSVQGYARTLLILLVSASMLPAVAVIVSLRQKNSELRAQERRLEEHRVAKVIHQSLRPGHPPLTPGWSLAALHQPAASLGGDFYDIFTLPDGRVMAAVGTVRGAGVDASVVMAITRTALRGSAMRGIAPDEALGCSSELLSPDAKDGIAVDCVLTTLDPSQARLTYASAGGQTLILRSGSDAGEDVPSGPPLGQDYGATFRSLTWDLLPGEAVLLVSHGAFAGTAGAGPDPLQERLRRAAAGARNAEQALAAVEAELSRSREPAEQPSADATVLCIARSGANAPGVGREE